MAAGLTYPSLAETARDISAWWDEQDDERRARAVRRWPSAEQEAAVLARLRGWAAGLPDGGELAGQTPLPRRDPHLPPPIHPVDARTGVR